MDTNIQIGEALAKFRSGKQNTPSSTPPATDIASAVAQYRAQKSGSAPVQATASTGAEWEPAGGFVGNLLTGSTQKFGKTIGESIAAPENAGVYADSSALHSEVQDNLTKAIATKKKLGQDTSRLEEALQRHVQETPQLEQFTGDVINKTPGQVVGEGVGTGLEALSGGLFSSGKNVVASKTLSTLGKAEEGAKIGALYGAVGGGSSEMQAGGDLADTLVGAGKGAVIGGTVGAAVPLVFDGLRKTGTVAKKVKNTIFPTLTEEEKVGRIIQGKTKDIPSAQRTFGVLTSEKKPVAKMTPVELSKTLESKVIKPNLESVDSQFAKDTTGGRSIKSLTQTVGKGKSAVEVNYVKQGIDELKAYYSKTGDAQGLSEMKALENKARINGLTSQDINELARRHGNTIKAFNLNGEAASGLSKQAAENTRTGIKSTARNVLGETNKEAAVEAARLDRQTSEAIKTKKLIDKRIEAENKNIQKNGRKGTLSKAYNSKTGKVIRAVTTAGLGIGALNQLLRD